MAQDCYVSQLVLYVCTIRGLFTERNNLMHADLYNMFYGNYKFTAELDTGSEMGGDQLIVWFAEKVDIEQASHVFGEPRFLRDFYFEEASKHHIKDFCQKFALDEAYRQDVLAGRTHWAMRDALFMRNLL